MGGAYLAAFTTDPLDQDDDDLPDAWEQKYGFDPTTRNNPQADTDEDGLTDAEEVAAATHPRKKDTDGDGLDDYLQIRFKQASQGKGNLNANDYVPVKITLADKNHHDDAWRLHLAQGNEGALPILITETQPGHDYLDGLGITNYKNPEKNYLRQTAEGLLFLPLGRDYAFKLSRVEAGQVEVHDEFKVSFDALGPNAALWSYDKNQSAPLQGALPWFHKVLKDEARIFVSANSQEPLSDDLFAFVPTLPIFGNPWGLADTTSKSKAKEISQENGHGGEIDGEESPDPSPLQWMADTQLMVELWDINGTGVEDDAQIEPWEDSQDITTENIAWITAHRSDENATPRMPQLEFRVPDLLDDMRIEAKLHVQYNRGNGLRATRNQDEDEVNIPADGNFTQVNGSTWQIYNDTSWVSELTENGFFGGDATLTYKITRGENVLYGPEDIQFRIGGENPDDNRSRNYIESRPNAGPNGSLWFAYAIAKHETANVNGANSRYNQFLVTDEIGRPVWGNDGEGRPGGYGLFQVSGTEENNNGDIPRTLLWNWQENVNEGLEILTSKRRDAVRWMIRQRDANNANGVAVPNHTVGTVVFAEDTNRTITDAVTIKLFNSASRAPVGFVDRGIVPGFRLDSRYAGHYCYWRNASSQWALSRYNALLFNYVERVCEEVD